jgi:hypothetical protein
VKLKSPDRSFDLHQRLTTFLVCAVATVLFTRSLLAATGYPQVGNSTLHIAHVLYGGLLLVCALISTLAFLSPTTKPLAAVAGGIGFGLFIDEVGKFVTKDVNYFYRPAFAIIYITFLVLFALVRQLSRRRFSAEEATLIGLEALQRAAVGALSEERRLQALDLLEASGAEGVIAEHVKELLEAAAEVQAQRSTLRHRLTTAARGAWLAFSRHRLFRSAVFAVLALAAAISAAEAAWLLRAGVSHLSFSQKAFTLTTLAADVLLALGAARLPRSRLAALRWYDHAVLLEITVAQVFLYTSEQLVATLNLVALLVLWVALRWAIEFETGAARRDAAPTLQQPGAAAAAR